MLLPPIPLWKTLRNAWLRRAVARQRRISPARDWGFSAVVLAAGLAVGASALPGRAARGPGATLLMDTQQGNAGVSQAVFALRPDGTAIRFANAETGAGGVIRVGYYNPVDPLLAVDTEPMSLPGDARLLWLLASPEERAAIRERAGALAVAVSGSVRDILASPEFANFYRDRFLAVIQDAARHAWDVTQKNGSWRALLRSYEPMLRDLANRDIRPVVERYFRTVPLRLLRANAVTLIDPFSDRNWNLQPVEEALKAALTEIRDREVPERIATQLMDTPQTTAFLRSFQDEIVRQLAHSNALHGLVSEMVFDERFRPYIAQALARANDLGRFAPRLLVSLHGSRDLNLVAATVIRNMINGRGDRVVVFMTPEQREEIAALDPSAVRMLERLGRP